MKDKIFWALEKTEDDSHKIFRIIKDDVKRSVALFKKHSARRRFTEDEEEMIEILNRDIEEAERYFDNRIEKIEKEDL